MICMNNAVYTIIADSFPDASHISSGRAHLKSPITVVKNDRRVYLSTIAAPGMQSILRNRGSAPVYILDSRCNPDIQCVEPMIDFYLLMLSAVTWTQLDGDRLTVPITFQNPMISHATYHCAMKSTISRLDMNTSWIDHGYCFRGIDCHKYYSTEFRRPPEELVSLINISDDRNHCDVVYLIGGHKTKELERLSVLTMAEVAVADV